MQCKALRFVLGCGIPVQGRELVGSAGHCTSKLSSFDDIASGEVLTRGFRGEALYLIAQAADCLVGIVSTHMFSLVS